MNIVLLPFLTRWMSPGEFGVLGVASALLLLLQQLVAVGLGGAVVRYYFEYSGDHERFRRFFSAAFWFQLLVVGVLLVVVASLLGSGVISSVVGLKPAILLPLLLAVALVPPRDIGNQLLTARQEHARASVNQLISSAVATAVSLWLVGSLGWGAAGRLYGLAAGALVAAIMIYYTPQISNNLRLRWDWAELRLALRYGLPIVPHAAALSGMAAIDRLVLRHYMTLQDVGIYTAAMTLAMGMSFVSIAIGRAWYPRFFQLRDAGDGAGAQRGHWAILCVMPLMVTGFCVLFPVVYPLLVAPAYLSGMKLLPVMALASFGFGLFNTQASYLSYWKRTLWFPLTSGSGVIVSTALALILVPRFQLAGAAWATALGYLAMSLMLLFAIWRLEEGRLKPVVLPVLSILLAIVGVTATQLIPGESGWMPRLVLSGVVTLGFGALWFFGEQLLMRDRPHPEDRPGSSLDPVP